jgi:hypothetical protein
METISRKADPEKLKDYAKHVFGLLNGAVTSALVYLGDELGLYRALAEGGPATSAELAARTGLAERWVREWLYNQGAARVLETQPDGRFAISPEGRAVLADERHPAFGAGMFSQLPKTLGLVEQLRGAFQTGVGLPYDAIGPEGARGIERGFAPWVKNFLVRAGVPAIAGLKEKLDAGARVAAPAPQPTSATAPARRCSSSRARSPRPTCTATSSRASPSRAPKKTSARRASRTCASTT